jgi:hypothetical protein
MEYSKEKLKEIEISAERSARDDGFNFEDNMPRYVAIEFTEQMDLFIANNNIKALGAFVSGLKNAQAKRQVRINSQAKKEINKSGFGGADWKHDGRFTWYIRAFTRLLTTDKTIDKSVARKISRDRLMSWLDLGFSSDSETSFKAALAEGQIDVAMRINPPMQEALKLKSVFEACLNTLVKNKVSKVDEKEFSLWWAKHKDVLKVETDWITSLISVGDKEGAPIFQVVLPDLIKTWCMQESKKKTPGRKLWQLEVVSMCIEASSNVDARLLQLIIDALKIGLGEKNLWMILEPKVTAYDKLGVEQGVVPLIKVDEVEPWSDWCMNRKLMTACDIWEKNGVKPVSNKFIQKLLKVVDSKMDDEDNDYQMEELKAFKSATQRKMLIREVSASSDRTDVKVVAL